MPLANILAGNIAAIRATFPALEGHGSLAGTTAKVCITDPAGTSTAIPSDVTIGFDYVLVEADWEIPDDQPRGGYTVTIDISGPLEAAAETGIGVRGRVEPNVP